MCGIAGFVGNLDQSSAVADLTQMMEHLRHRGPDSRDHFFSPERGVGLAHTRLSIVDLSENGKQPMTSVSGRYTLTFNGEIYNFQKIRKNLLNQGCTFRGSSDTEVLLASIDLYGLTKTLQEVAGMFALALFDREENSILLARDRAGEKPLYYSIVNNNLIFASELKALSSSSMWQGEVSEQQVAQLMQFGYVPVPHSIYKNTYKLPQGSLLKLFVDPQSHQLKNVQDFSPFPGDRQYKTCPEIWWQLADKVQNPQRPSLSFDETLEQFSDLFRSVVADQMISDVPVGSFLSGGIDSSLVVATMQSVSSSPVKSFSIGFTEEKYNEAHYAKEVAEHLGTDHTELYVTPEQTRDVIPSLHEIYSEPFADSSQIPTFLVSRLAREKVTVSLSGDGGDELFGGYTRYFMAQKVWRLMNKVPSLARRGGIELIQTLSPETWDSLYSGVRGVLPSKFRFNLFGNKLYKMTEVLRANSSMEVYQKLISQWQNPSLAVPGNGQEESHRSWAPSIENQDFREQMMYMDFCHYLTDDLLVKVDRAAMANSLETRIPLLDHRIVEFAWSLPMEAKIQHGKGKRLLREMLYRHVPRHLVDRPKMGFGIPVGEWLRGPLKEWGEDLLSEPELAQSGFFDVATIRNRWKEHQEGHLNWQASLWCVLMFQQWYKARPR